MDYSNYFCFSVFVLFVITTVCSGASLGNMQDVGSTEQQESEDDKTDALMSSSVMTQAVSSAISSTQTAQGDIIITTSAEAIGSQSVSPEGTLDLSSSSSAENQGVESSVPSQAKPELPSTSSEISDETSMSDTETKIDEESTQATASSTEPSNTEKPNTVEPESTSPGETNNGASTVALPNAFGLFLIVFVSRSLFLKT